MKVNKMDENSMNLIGLALGALMTILLGLIGAVIAVVLVLVLCVAMKDDGIGMSPAAYSIAGAVLGFIVNLLFIAALLA